MPPLSGEQCAQRELRFHQTLPSGRYPDGGDKSHSLTNLTSLMLHRFTRILIVAALIFSIGLHWVVLQSVAWAGMLVTYTVQEGSLINGVSQTFDSEHPCPLCCAIKKGRHSEKKEPRQADSKQKIDLALSAAERVILTPPALTLSPLPDFPHGTVRRARPPSPPPRREGFSCCLS